MSEKIKTSGAALAEAIGRREDVQTHGALRAENVIGLGRYDDGQLRGEDLIQFDKDYKEISYVVWGYQTPIAWVARGKVYKVKQKFSRTTSKHQGQLYLL